MMRERRIWKISGKEHQILDCVHFFSFCHQNKNFKKLSKMLFILPKRLLLSSRFSNFCTLLFPPFCFFDHCWFYWKSWLMINTRFYAINIVPKLDFKTADSLISGEVDLDTWSIDRVLYRENFHGKIWQSQGQLWQVDSLAYSLHFILYEPKVHG